ncbi:MAG: tRNA dihydrouridine synthase DusB [Gemmatimonadetes bacterium]|nr:tRNA dihydrouridine synthase DusB [Gemmatimonadota bacterium]
MSYHVGNLNLDHPLLLAPMEDVSDLPFRVTCRRLGADLVYTEFISSEALVRDVPGALRKLTICDEERPVGIQIFGATVEVVGAAAEIAEQAGPDLIDINLGCPVKNVALKGAGAGLLKEPKTMEAMVREVVKRVSLPVTVKTRLGWDDASIRILENVRMFEDCGVQAVNIHARTRCQMYKGEADWVWIARAKEVASIPIGGNGDAMTAELAARMFETTGCDAVMLGRGAIADPWIFAEAKHWRATSAPLPPRTLDERIAACLEHLRFSVAYKADERRALVEFRKFYKGYLRGAAGAAQLRSELMTLTTLAEVEERLATFLAQSPGTESADADSAAYAGAAS